MYLCFGSAPPSRNNCLRLESGVAMSKWCMSRQLQGAGKGMRCTLWWSKDLLSVHVEPFCSHLIGHNKLLIFGQSGDRVAETGRSGDMVAYIGQTPVKRCRGGSQPGCNLSVFPGLVRILKSGLSVRRGLNYWTAYEAGSAKNYPRGGSRANMPSAAPTERIRANCSHCLP